MSTKTPIKTLTEWVQERTYIGNTTDAVLHSGRPEIALRPFSHDRQCFIRYCEMQRNCATKDGRDDSAQYIQHCIDDLTD